MKNILVLGAGLVSKPLVHYLLKKNFEVKVASRTVSKAIKLVEGFENGRAEELNVKNDDQLEKLIIESDLTISLLPYNFHVKVAKLCITHKKHLVTTSYVSNEMNQLDEEAKSAGILILNEIGLDPGIDHMSAMQIIDNVKKNDGKVTSFKSYCGGLPDMQHNNNPFGYKFSWSPRGVVMAGRNDGQYLEKGDVVYIPGKDLFKHYDIIDIEDVGNLEAYTNRDALPYQELYGLNDAQTIFRGTLRYVGWCYTKKKAQELGLFDDAPRKDLVGLTYAEMIQKLIESEDIDYIEEDTANFLGLEIHSNVIKKFKWLGLFSNALLPDENNVMDMYSALLQKKLAMGEKELDLIILHHRFEASYGNKKEYITSTLVDSGIPDGDSAMSRTVSLPAAIAAALILEGKIKVTGVKIPVMPELYNPVLAELETMGLKFIEKTKPVE